MLLTLFEPEIPPNTGNVARLCAAMGVELHLVEPLGFKLQDRYLKRAGLDYWPHVQMRVWRDWQSFRQRAERPENERLVAASTKAALPLHKFVFQENDALILGPETRGLPADLLTEADFCVRIPMIRMENGGVRSLNLATAAGIVLYEALRTSGLLDAFAQ